MGRPELDLTDQTIGRLTVIRRTEKRDLATGCWLWECRCECGSVCEVPTVRLRSKRTKSCGCLQKAHFSGEIKSAKRPEFPPTEGCFAFRGDHCDCLTEMVCRKKGKCAFYQKG